MDEQTPPLTTDDAARPGFAFGPFRLYPAKRLLLRHDEPVALGARALDILIALVERQRELVTKAELSAQAWPNMLVEESNLRVQVAALRKALRDGQDGARYIVATPGRGYRFVATTARPAEARPSPTLVHHWQNLPVRLSRVIGRDDVVSAIGLRLTRRRLVAIVGEGGIGKTTVAVAVAQQLAASYANGVCFVELASLADPGLLPAAIASAFGLPPLSHDPVAELVALLADKRVLLVLDTCERIVDAAAAAAETILRGAPGIDILATSREPLRAEGESVHRLAPLATAPGTPGLTAAEALAFPAVELFVERASSHVESYRLSDQEAPLAANICRQLDGIPLAIELAAARVEAFGTRGVASRLHDRFRLLTGGRRTALPRHRTLTATLNWSYDGLNPAEQNVLRRIALFAGGFTLDAAAAVVGGADVPELLSNLVAKSLVSARTDDEAPRYRLLDTTHAYALDKLATSGELAAIARRHAEYYRAVLGKEAGTDGWISALAMELANIRAALDWAFAGSGDAALGRTLAVAAVPLWFQLSLTDECRDRVQQALTSLEPGPAQDAQVRDVMQLYCALGLSRSFTSGLAPQAPVAWKKAFELAETLDDPDGRLEALWGLWLCHLGCGEYRAALAGAERFASFAQTPPDLAIADRLRGVPLHWLGDHAAARRYLERAIDQQPPSPISPRGVRFRSDQPAAARAFLAPVLWLQGLPEQAMAAARNSVEEAEASGHAISLCDALAQAVCPITIFTGDHDLAERSIARLLETATQHALDPWIALGACWSSIVMIKRDKVAQGVAGLSASLRKLRNGRFAFYHTGLLGTLAEGLASIGQEAESLAAIDEALDRCEAHGEGWCLPEMVHIKGAILGDADLLARAVQSARRQGMLAWELRAAISLVALRGRSQAGPLLAEAYGRFREGFETQDLRAAKTLLDQPA